MEGFVETVNGFWLSIIIAKVSAINVCVCTKYVSEKNLEITKTKIKNFKNIVIKSYLR